MRGVWRALDSHARRRDMPAQWSNWPFQRSAGEFLSVHEAIFWPTATVIVAVSAYLQGSVGIGFAMLAAPLLLLLDPAMAPASVLVAMLVLSGLMSIADRAHIDTSRLYRLLPGLLLGTLAAVAVLPFLASSVHRVTGAIILFAVAASFANVRIPDDRRTFGLVGTFAGFTGTISSMHGPALAIAFRHAPVVSARATIALVFVAACVSSLVALQGSDALTVSDWRNGALLVPGVLVGYLVSRLKRFAISDRLIRRLVLIVAGFGGLALLLR